MTNSSRKIIVILIAVIAILLLVLIYAFAIKPKINGFIINNQLKGYQIAYSEILQAVGQCKSFPVTVDNNGTTINLVALECLQQGNSGVAQGEE